MSEAEVAARRMGAELAAFCEGAGRIAKAFNDGIVSHTQIVKRLAADPEVRYRLRIEQERQIGLAQVRAHAARVRRELGL